VTYQVSLTPEAEADIEEAHLWYAERGIDLAEDFRRSLDQCIATIASYPEGFPVVHRSVRRALLRRFPYCIFYVLGPERAIVVGCFHARRDPSAWRVRAAG
jgi:plasmid stabilization system protein ParE